MIGGNGQQTIFSGNKTINLLDLYNFNEPIAFGEVLAGDYTKIRLQISGLKLEPKDGKPSIFPTLPANGKIDLLDQGRFTVFPGRTLVIEIDIDANKSVHIVGTGNGTYQFRPVVKVNIMDGGLPDKLARLEGVVAAIYDDPAGKFLLCSADFSDVCVVVYLAKDGSVFDAEGLPVSFGKLMIDDFVTVIGRYRQDDANNTENTGVDEKFAFEAIVIEIGGNADQVKGIVASTPNENDQFDIVVDKNDIVTVQIQNGTKFVGKDGALDRNAIVISQEIEVEGVIVKPAVAGDPKTVNAALILIDDGLIDDKLSGTIAEPLDSTNMSFNLSAGISDVCVNLNNDSVIILISENADGTEVKIGTFADLATEQSVDTYGQQGIGGCFEANEVIVDLTGQP
ncbi:MAG: hypothetical protein DRR11_11170 [Gammaproteobacteria bacterium]|nr:MAG: hypothetical protein DRR11_11170 [Gammaproteobacteria bacterium]